MASDNAQLDVSQNVQMEKTSTDCKQEATRHVLENNIIVHIKPENLNDELMNEDFADNPFENVQVEIKRELCDDVIEKETNLETDKQLDTDIEHNIIVQLEMDNKDSQQKFEIKQERGTEESLVSYDYPSFDDGGSMDSNDATALGNVEACLQDDANINVNIKNENYGALEYTSFHMEKPTILPPNELLLLDPEDTDEVPINDSFHLWDIKISKSEENLKLDLEKVHVKDELELTVTETHLISNKVINTTSTVTNHEDGLTQSETTKTIVMEIHPMLSGSSLSKMSNPEEILPTTYDHDESDSANYGDLFQLNSITGNELSLEQEAYGLLKATGEKDVQKIKNNYYCPKCPKVCNNHYGLKRHMSIHDTIEKRAMGVIKGQKTKKENRNKKLQGIDDELSRDESDDIQDSSSKVSGRKARIENRNKKRSAQDTGLNYKGVKKRKKKIKDDPDEKFSVRIRSYKEEGHNRQDSTSEFDVKVIKHENIKKEGYQCTCGNVFQRRSRLETCLRSHNLIPDINSCFSCPSCNKQFNDKSELALHRRRIHRKRFPCKFCPTDYNTRKELLKHLQIHQKVQLMEYKVISEVVRGKQKLKCFMCAKTWSELSELKCHVMEDHKEPYTCPHCQDTFSKIIDFGNHTKTFHPEVEGQSVLNVLEAFSKLVKAWKCVECELQFHDADKLALHQIEKHSPDLKTESQYQCADCRRVFISQKGLTSHRRIHHNTDSVEETETLEKGVMCIECRKICRDETALTSHMRFHSQERKYPCRFCDFRFATPEKRKTHAEIHTGDMKFVCFICEYQCSSENRLNQHKMSVKHLNMREILRTGMPLIPEESTSKKDKAKETPKKRRSDKRKGDVSEDEPSSSWGEGYTCDICGDKFSSENSMLEHKQTHPFIEFPNEDKPTRIFFK